MRTIFIQRILKKTSGYKPPLKERTVEITGDDEEGQPVRIVLKEDDADSIARFVKDTRERWPFWVG